MSEFLEPAIEELWNKNKGILEDYIRNVLLNFNELTFKDFLSGIFYKIGLIDYFCSSISYSIYRSKIRYCIYPDVEAIILIVCDDYHCKYTSAIYFDFKNVDETPLSRIQDPTKKGEKPDGWQVFDAMVLVHEILANMIDHDGFIEIYRKVTPD